MVSIVVKGHHDHSHSYKGRHLIGGVVMEKELRILPGDPQAAGRDNHTGYCLRIYMRCLSPTPK